MRKILLLFAVIPLLAGKLPLKNAVLHAMEKNPEILVYKYTPVQAKSQFEATKSLFIPTFSLTTSASRDQQKPNSIFGGRSEEVKSNHETGGLSLVQNIPSGGQINFGITQDRNYTTNIFFNLNPSYTSIFQLTISHPLLKNFGSSVTKQSIIIAKKGYEKSLFDFKSKASDIIFQVVQSYWNYLYNIKVYRVKGESLRLAQNLYKQNREMVKVGTKAPIDIIEAESEVESRKAELIDARNTIENSREELARETGIVDIPQDPSLLEVPKLAKEEMDLNSMINLAMKENPRILAARKDMETANFKMKVKKNALKPELNLQLVLSSIGRGGDKVLYENNNPFGGKIIGKVPGSPIDSLNEALKANYNSVELQLVYTMPIKRKKEIGEFQAAVAEYYQSKRNYEMIRSQVRYETKQAWRNAMSAFQRIKATKKAEELAEEKLKAELEKFAHGASTNYMVLTYQRDLANAKINALKAIMDYNIALYNLRKSTGSIIPYFGVKIKADEDFGGYNLIQ